MPVLRDLPGGVDGIGFQYNIAISAGEQDVGMKYR